MFLIHPQTAGATKQFPFVPFSGILLPEFAYFCAPNQVKPRNTPFSGS
jgi:hypothetical protein